MLIIYYVTLFSLPVCYNICRELRILFKSWKVLTVEDPGLGFHFYVIDK